MTRATVLHVRDQLVSQNIDSVVVVPSTQRPLVTVEVSLKRGSGVRERELSIAPRHVVGKRCAKPKGDS